MTYEEPVSLCRTVRETRVRQDGRMEQPTDEQRVRFPRWVYGVGTEPDARFSLANERTFLAWVRTALGLIAAGVALEALDLPIRAELSLAAAVVLVTCGVLAPVGAWIGWARTERALRCRLPLPAPHAFSLVGLGVLAAGVLVLVGLLT